MIHYLFLLLLIFCVCCCCCLNYCCYHCPQSIGSEYFGEALFTVINYVHKSVHVIRIAMSYVNIIMNYQFFELFFLYVGARYSMSSWCDGSSDRSHMVYPWSFFSFQPVLQYWYNKGHGMRYPVCGMMHIKVTMDHMIHPSWWTYSSQCSTTGVTKVTMGCAIFCV